jgi:hypothetical protein
MGITGSRTIWRKSRTFVLGLIAAHSPKETSRARNRRELFGGELLRFGDNSFRKTLPRRAQVSVNLRNEDSVVVEIVSPHTYQFRNSSGA